MLLELLIKNKHVKTEFVEEFDIVKIVAIKLTA